MDISLLKRALLDPALYPDSPKEVRALETHISVLFLTGRHVYKVKKPVDFGFLDFTSLEKRKYFCEREVKLNRRLAADLYLGVVAVTEDRGRISFGGRGEILEYAVKMVELPEDGLLDTLLEKGKLTPAIIRAVSERLTVFYATAETSDTISRFGRPERIKQNTDENFLQTETHIGVTIPGDIYAVIQERTNRFLESHEKRFYQRIGSGRIRDCHGDLRLEHIFYGNEISAIDCIEFNDKFRYTDIAADLGFLAMDLDYHGRGDLADHLIRAYIHGSGDTDIGTVLDLYKCYRAYVRGKVESFKLDDPGHSGAEKQQTLDRARKYFDLSYRYALEL